MVILHPSAILRVDSKKDDGMNYDQTSAVNFLLYSTMMVTLEDSTEAAIDAAIKRAYRDANSHVLSGYDESKGHEAIKDGLMNLRDIDSTPNQGSFDEWHEKTCEAICTKGYKATSKIAQKGITYGIAQKWLNMTLKYLTVFNAIRSMDSKQSVNTDVADAEHDGILEKINGLKGCLHVPVDRYIINAAWNNTAVKIPLKNSTKIEQRNCEYKHPADYCKPWSQWTFEDYKKFQESLRKALPKQTLFEWEGTAWITTARTENKLKKN